MKNAEEIRDELMQFLLKKIDYSNHIERNRHFDECVEVLYEARKNWPLKEDFLIMYKSITKEFYEVHWIKFNRDTDELYHEAYVDDLMAFVHDFYNPILFWEKNSYEEYIMEKGNNIW